MLTEFDTDFTNLLIQKADGGTWSNFSSKAASVCHTRTLVITRKGYFGLGPGATRAGDLCCIIFGSPVPLILRHADENYQLVGEAYVHGVMNGEAVEQLDQGKSQQNISSCVEPLSLFLSSRLPPSPTPMSFWVLYHPFPSPEVRRAWALPERDCISRQFRILLRPSSITDSVVC